MTPKQASLGREAVQQAAAYLRSCGIRLPRFRVTTEAPENRRPGGSFVDGHGGTLRLNIGRYPGSFLRHWFAMHELGHVLWAHHQPLRWKRFRNEFGAPRPKDYDTIHKSESWKTAASFGKLRPPREPSFYGALGGGDERWAELLALMYVARAGFDREPPSDLADLWSICWHDGLSRMT